MTPEQSLKLTDLRQRILENERAGRPAHEGITPEDLSEGLAVLRQNRSVGTSRGGTASGEARATKAKAKKAAAIANVDQAKLKNLLGDLD